MLIVRGYDTYKLHINCPNSSNLHTGGMFSKFLFLYWQIITGFQPWCFRYIEIKIELRKILIVRKSGFIIDYNLYMSQKHVLQFAGLKYLLDWLGCTIICPNSFNLQEGCCTASFIVHCLKIQGIEIIKFLFLLG